MEINNLPKYINPSLLGEIFKHENYTLKYKNINIYYYVKYNFPANIKCI